MNHDTTPNYVFMQRESGRVDGIIPEHLSFGHSPSLMAPSPSFLSLSLAPTGIIHSVAVCKGGREGEEAVVVSPLYCHAALCYLSGGEQAAAKEVVMVVNGNGA